jgi:hypothetical protein
VREREMLGKAVEVVTFLFAMFGGFLSGIAPPERVGTFAVGFGSFLALILFLFVAVIAKGRFSRQRRKIWLAVAGSLAAMALSSGVLYQQKRSDWTFAYPPENGAEELLGGTVYQPRALADKEQRGWSVSQLVAEYGGPSNRHLIWTEESLGRARTFLTLLFLTLVLSLAGTIFCLVELYLAIHPEPVERGSHQPTNTKAAQ